MSQHGRSRAAATEPSEYEDEESVRRFGFLTMESALVLGLALLIVLGSLLVHVVLPSKHETTTVVGDKKVKITTVGTGGVQPGPVVARQIVAPVATPVPSRTPKPPKPVKTAAPVVTTGPTAEPTKGSGGGVLNPGGGGGGGGGGNECTVLILCKPGQKPAETPSPDPAASNPAATNPAQPPGQSPQVQ